MAGVVEAETMVAVGAATVTAVGAVGMGLSSVMQAEGDRGIHWTRRTTNSLNTVNIVY